MAALELTLMLIALGTIFTIMSFLPYVTERTLWAIVFFPLAAMAVWWFVAILIQDVVYVKAQPVVVNATNSGSVTTYQYAWLKEEVHYSGGWPLGAFFMGLGFVMLVYAFYAVLILLGTAVQKSLPPEAR